MHTATQLIAQRAPPASRTTKAARWQPYYSLQMSALSLPLKSPSINTPSSSSNVSSPHSSLPTPIPASEIGRSRPQIPATTQTPKESFQRDSSKNKFTSGLIDQTVHLLSDIWHPQNIPHCFLPPGTKAGGTSPPSFSPLQCAIKALTSKEGPHPPSTQPHILPSEQGSSTPTAALAILASETDSDQELLPLKNFVHEVLRRSRTSGNVLQTALCYLEAIRTKVPEILQQENVGIRACFQPESRIQPATPEELEREALLAAVEPPIEILSPEDLLKTVRVTDSGPDDEMSNFDSEPTVQWQSVSPSSSTSFTSLPSPLLCPRRAFLASLILASKFSQDKSYSNRAWAKLSGLPPREVGRCERALGQALQWRLWVGKAPVSSEADTPVTTTSTSAFLHTNNTPSRSVVRSQSESVVIPTKPFMCEDLASSANRDLSELRPRKAVVQVGLRRCSTLPADVIASSSVPPPSNTSVDPSVGIQFSDSQGDNQISLYATGSPDPTTPGLSDSPTSTDCSDERILPLSGLEDNISSSYDGFVGKAWLDDSACHTESPLAFIGSHCGYESQEFQHPVAVIEIDTATYGPNFYWNSDPRFVLESAGVH